MNELAYLTAEIGCPLDAKQLQATLNDIGAGSSAASASASAARTSITADEFHAWLSGNSGSLQTAAGAQSALLRARLWRHKAGKLSSQIAKRKGE